MSKHTANSLIMLGMATENSLGYLLELFESRPDELWLLQTKHAAAGGFGKHLEPVCRLLGCRLKLLPVKQDQSLTGLLAEIHQLAGSEDRRRFIVNLAGGIKHHNLALWEFFRAHADRCSAVFNNLQSKIRLTWSWDNGLPAETRHDIAANLTVDSLVRLYGCELRAETELYTPGITDLPARIREHMGARYSNGIEPGYRWEKWVAGSLLRLIRDAGQVKISRMLLNGKIMRGTVIIAEYDIIIETTDLRIILVECKAGKFTVKDIKAQAALAAEWGAAFADFALCLPLGFSENEAETAPANIRTGLAENGIKVFTGPRSVSGQKSYYPLGRFLEVFRLKS